MCMCRWITARLSFLTFSWAFISLKLQIYNLMS